MSDPELYPVPTWAAERAHMNREGYEAAWAQVKADPEAFWSDKARRLDWFRAPTRIKDVSYAREDFRIRWFENGVLNVGHNCLDRHLAERGHRFFERSGLLFGTLGEVIGSGGNFP